MTVHELDGAALAAHPLPDPSEPGDKHERGTVLIVGGTTETPGALGLAGTAALRAGAGRLCVAAPEPVAAALAVDLVEARVTPFAIDAGDVATAAGCRGLRSTMADADAVAVGAGTVEPVQGGALLAAALDALADGDGCLAIDAASLAHLAEDDDQRERVRSLGRRVVLMPNQGEAAALLGGELDDDLAGAVRELVAAFGCTVAIRAERSWISAPGQPVWVEQGGTPGLGTSGSGDVLGGILAGYLARGADPLTATLWAVHVHACAGARLADRHGPTGLLARELLDLIPAVQHQLTPGRDGIGAVRDAGLGAGL